MLLFVMVLGACSIWILGSIVHVLMNHGEGIEAQRRLALLIMLSAVLLYILSTAFIIANLMFQGKI